MILIDVLDPIGEPGNSVVMDHLLPRSRCIRFRYRLVLTDVNRDILRTDAVLVTVASDACDT